MIDRREFLGAAGLAALATAVPAVAAAPRWKPYRDTVAIDALGGTELVFLKPDDPGVPVALKALRESGLSAVMTNPAPYGRFWYTDEAYNLFKQRTDEWRQTIERYPDALLLVRNGEDLHRAKRENKVGLIFTFQGAEPLGEDVERIPQFRAQGVRVIQLTHNRRNLVGDGCTEPGNAGLSRFGHQVVERLNAEKMVVDLAHGGQRTIREGILASKAPVLIGHTGCRALVDVPRMVGDAELKLMADRGGVAGMIFWPYIRKQGQQTSADVIAHIEHAIKVCGEDHVGIGTDLNLTPVELTPEFRKENTEMIKQMIADGIFEPDRDPNLLLFPPDLNTADRFDTLAALLSARGHSDARIAKILGGNFARVMTEVWG
ncbi:dipeptidase [Lysobacter silvisoli]|uniref:Peptidase M19 n=1 Tax=Lysobacter silvisoli TaxID=2293254 RepID=A0A371JWV8_9GAMM|nr:membrane dipeptidase [Lysobacter silvisoli]RDZ26077.1 peptidase M19 [Lysobacter silvisoli]